MSSMLPEDWWLALFVPIILLIVQQCLECRGWCRVPRRYNRTERKIMFRPIQYSSKSKKIFEFGDALIATKPLLALRNDIVDCLNTSLGGMLAVCDPFGHGKTSTAVGAALARFEDMHMPNRALCLLPELGKRGAKSWFETVKEIAGIPLSMCGDDAAIHLFDAMAKTNISTKRSKRLRFVEGVDRDKLETLLIENANYGVLVIDDFSPPELKDKNASSTEELITALKDKESYDFLYKLATLAHTSRVVVVVTTNCENALRLIHHGINGGQKAKAAPFTTIHAANPHGTIIGADAIKIPRDHCGMGWDEQSRLELFVEKYPSYAGTADGTTKTREFADDMRISVRQCCEELFYLNDSRCAKVYLGLSDYWNDYVVDSFQRFFCCQPACNVVEDATTDYEVELGNSPYRQMV